MFRYYLIRVHDRWPYLVQELEFSPSGFGGFQNNAVEEVARSENNDARDMRVLEQKILLEIQLFSILRIKRR